MSERRARVGVVGAGWWARRVHLPALRDNPDAELVAVCDRDLGRAGEAARQFGAAQAVAAVGDLLALGVDAVVVATPHDAHHGPAAAALDAGVDVLVEKPMTLVPDQAWDLVRRASRSGSRLHVGYTFPYSPHAVRLRSVLRAGELGPLLLVSSLFATSVLSFYQEKAGSQAVYADPERGGGQLYTQLTHPVSLVLWLTGLPPVTVAAHAGRHDTAVDVADTLAVVMSGGTIASFATTGTVHDGELRLEEYRFFGAGGHAALDTRRGTLEVFRRDGGPEPGPAPADGTANPVAAPSAALVAAALGKAPVVVPGELGALTVEVLHAARQSIRTGEMVSVGRDPELAKE